MCLSGVCQGGTSRSCTGRAQCEPSDGLCCGGGNGSTCR
jgi:hypothetical protein